MTRTQLAIRSIIRLSLRTMLTRHAENGTPGAGQPGDPRAEIRYRNEVKDAGVQTDDYLMPIPQPKEQAS